MLRLLAASLLGLGPVVAHGDAQRPLPLPAALERASEEHRPVLASITETHCSACEHFEKLLAADAALSAWLAEHFVLARIDPREERELAERYDLVQHPTLLVLRADGSEIDRLVGRKSSGDLRRQLERVLSLSAAERSVHDIFARHLHAQAERGNELYRRHRPDEAARAWVEALQDPVHGKPTRSRGIRPNVLRSLQDAERWTEGCGYTLREWRDACLDRVVTRTDSPADEGDVLDATKLLAWPADAFTVHERLRAAGRLTPGWRSALMPLALGPLVANGREEEVFTGLSSPREAMRSLIPELTELDSGRFVCGVARSGRAREASKKIDRIEPLYTAALRTGRVDWVSGIESELAHVLFDQAGYALLTRAALDAGDPAHARDLIEGARFWFRGALSPGLLELERRLSPR